MEKPQGSIWKQWLCFRQVQSAVRQTEEVHSRGRGRSLYPGTTDERGENIHQHTNTSAPSSVLVAIDGSIVQRGVLVYGQQKFF